MSRLALVLVVAAALAAGLAGTAPAAPRVLTVGMADQKPDMFFDERFRDLGLEHARYAVGWDVMTRGWQIAEADRWLNAAREAGVTPLVSFGHSRLPSRRRSLPSVKRYVREFERFRRRYPWVRTFATWNEANHCGEPTCHRPRRVAQYWRAMRRACRRCTVLAAELLDMPNMVEWARRFRRHAKVEPRIWGLHNYVEANRFRSTRLRMLMRRIEGEVWLTEVGGLVRRRTNKKYTVRRIPESKAHAKKVTRWLFERLLPGRRRITRIYLYHWNSSTRRDTWDSGLIDANGRARPAFAVFKRQVRRIQARARQRAAAGARAR